MGFLYCHSGQQVLHVKHAGEEPPDFINMGRFFATLRMTVVCSIFFLSACSSPPKTVQEDVTPWQTISINTPGVSGANCFLQAGSMSYPMQAPGKVNVRKANSPMSVTCFKGEHMLGEQKVEPVCPNCGYPNSVTIAMSLDNNLFDRNVTQIR